MSAVSGIQRPEFQRVSVLEGGILRHPVAACLDMVLKVSTSRSDSSQSGLS